MKLIVDVRVSDLDRAVNFYTEVLGLVCRRKEAGWAAISVGDADLHLYLNGGVTGDVEFYVEDIDDKVTALVNKGVVFISGIDKPSAINVDGQNVTTFPWGRTAFFRDSEGNELAIVKDFE
jgi:predicted enzyme related to lactoylglutathione lyase